MPDAVSADRLARLLALQEEIQSGINQCLEGREFEVLIEGEDRKGLSRGRTPCNRIVHIEGARHIEPGSYVKARIQRGLPNSLLGRLSADAGASGERLAAG